MGYEKVLRGKIVQDRVFDGEIGINNGKIEKVVEGKNILKSDSIEDYESALIFPGFVDVHVHCFSNPNEGFTTTSRSAAVGGVTTFLDMPYDLPNPVNNVAFFNDKVKRLEEESVVDICLWGTISKTGGLDQIIPLAEAGAVAFKMSTFETDSYRFPRIPDDEILKAMELIQETGLIVAFHAENDEIIVSLIDEYKKENKVYPRAHNETRPPVSETTAVLKLMEFAKWTGVKLHIVHVSHPRTVELIEYFKSTGVQVTCETCYTYLLLDVDDLDKHGPKAKINPPLRHREDVDGLWKHIMDDHIDLISSDHAPWEEEHKVKGNDNIFLAASGMPGLEIIAPLLFSEGVTSGKITPEKFARLMATAPAEKFQIQNKGSIKEGYDADFAIIDPTQSWEIDEKRFNSYSKISPFNGKIVHGKNIASFVRGEKVYDGENVLVDPGFGKFVPGFAYKEENQVRG